MFAKFFCFDRKTTKTSSGTISHKRESFITAGTTSLLVSTASTMWNVSHSLQQVQHRFSSASLAQCEMWNKQHVLFCRFAIKETNFVLNCNNSFNVIFYSRRCHCKYDCWYEYDWRRRLSHVDMTDSDLTKYDSLRQLMTVAPGTSHIAVSCRQCCIGVQYVMSLFYIKSISPAGSWIIHSLNDSEWQMFNVSRQAPLDSTMSHW